MSSGADVILWRVQYEDAGDLPLALERLCDLIRAEGSRNPERFFEGIFLLPGWPHLAVVPLFVGARVYLN